MFNIGDKVKTLDGVIGTIDSYYGDKEVATVIVSGNAYDLDEVMPLDDYGIHAPASELYDASKDDRDLVVGNASRIYKAVEHLNEAADLLLRVAEDLDE
ncbi:hypothetical protein [Macrococcus capreoli]|uniref:hypothetical protein n=1 Tax=Macrococcus capreoli TaxID=2982690 RepID=UPI0021D5C62C|nr:hypothetical protein [Macrococcus sp. TMW 2.2395]MCU7556579.1 hypothetical protein [Macrococcus sp. TMW 2.2395]